MTIELSHPLVHARDALASATCLAERLDRAAAHRLARLIHAMLTRGEEYTDRGQAYYEERRTLPAARRGQPESPCAATRMQVVPIPPPAPA